MVHGRLYTRDWTDDQGGRRTSYELNAVAVGHDLSRGVDKFARKRPAGSTDMVNDGATAANIGGEATEPMDDPGRPEDLPPDHELFDDFDPAVADASPAVDPQVGVGEGRWQAPAGRGPARPGRWIGWRRDHPKGEPWLGTGTGGRRGVP